MGLLDRLRGGSGSSSSDDDPDHYRVCRKGADGGFEAVNGFDELDEPIKKDVFEYNAAPLDPGHYRLFAVKDGMFQQPPSGTGWTLEVEGQTRDERSAVEQKIDRLEQQLAGQQTGGQVDDPEALVDKQLAAFQLQMLQNEDFVKRHGEKLALAMFDMDTDEGTGEQISFDEWSENPAAASLFSAMNAASDDPKKIQDMGEALGGSLGAFVGGASNQRPNPAQQPADATETVADASPTADDSPTADPRPDVDGGPNELADLEPPAGAVDPDQLSETVAEARRRERELSGTVRREGPGTQSGVDTPAESTATADTQPADGRSDDPHPTDDLTAERDGPKPERADIDEFGEEFVDDDTVDETPDETVDAVDDSTSTPSPDSAETGRATTSREVAELL